MVCDLFLGVSAIEKTAACSCLISIVVVLRVIRYWSARYWNPISVPLCVIPNLSAFCILIVVCVPLPNRLICADDLVNPTAMLNDEFSNATR